MSCLLITSCHKDGLAAQIGDVGLGLEGDAAGGEPAKHGAGMCGCEKGTNASGGFGAVVGLGRRCPS